MIFLVIAAVLLVFIGFTAFFGAPYVPSRRQDIKAAFDDLYHLKSTDLVLDLGSGDGAVLVEVARRKAKAVGFELQPLLVLLSWWRLRRYPKARARFGNLWRTPFPNDTTLVYIFSDSRDIKRLIERIQSEANRLRKDLLVMSYAFEVPDGNLIAKNKSYFLYKIQPLH